MAHRPLGQGGIVKTRHDQGKIETFRFGCGQESLAQRLRGKPPSSTNDKIADPPPRVSRDPSTPVTVGRWKLTGRYPGREQGP